MSVLHKVYKNGASLKVVLPRHLAQAIGLRSGHYVRIEQHSADSLLLTRIEGVDDTTVKLSKKGAKL